MTTEEETSKFKFRCTVSGKYTELFSGDYRLPFYSDKFRLLFNEWISLFDYYNNSDFLYKTASLPDDSPKFHSLDPFTMYRLKRIFFEAIINDEEDESKIESLFLNIIKARDMYEKWFFDETHYNHMTGYLFELDTEIESDTTSLVQTKKNIIIAITKSRNATRRRYSEWFHHINNF